MVRKILRGLKEGMQEFGESIGTLINSVLLLVVYFIGVGVTAIAAKIAGKRFMQLKTENSETYWQDLGLKKRPLEEYYRQF